MNAASLPLKPRYIPQALSGPARGVSAPAVALLPAGGDLWEDFLDTIGVSLGQFCADGPGGWILGYIEALAHAGFRTVLLFFSAQVSTPARYMDESNGATLVVLPAPRSYRVLRDLAPGRLAGARPAGQEGALSGLLSSAASHLSTPFGRVADELRREQCGAIICQEYEYFRFDALTAIGRSLRIPVFATFQGSRSEHNLLSRLIKRRTIRATAGLLVAASSEADRVRRRYGHEVPVVQVFNPVRLDRWGAHERAETRARLGAGAETRIAVWHGRISMYAKGLDVLLAAWERVCRDHPERDFRLMLLGAGADAQALELGIAGTGLPNISWRNEYVTDPGAVRRFLSAGDVFAFASRMEGFPVAPLEAMACGVPVVATDASGVPDILAEGLASGGIMVPSDDVKAFAKALGRVLDDAALGEELGRRARARVAEAFSPEAVGRQVEKAFAGLTPAPRAEAQA